MTREEAIEVLQQDIPCERDTDLIEALDMAIQVLEQEPCDVFDKYGNYKYPSDVELTEPNTATSMPCEDTISRQAVLDLIADYDLSMGQVVKGVHDLPPVTPKPKTDVLDKIRAEIKEWYWQADKQALAKDPCVVDAMIDLFIRTIKKYKAESEEEE